MAASYDENGVWDSQKYSELIKGIDILTYNPPQKQVSFTGRCRNCNFWSPRSPWCIGFPCCLGESIRCCLKMRGHEVQDVYISKPDEWFLQMMEPPEEGNYCPEVLKGVWWMQDNIANETVVSLESAHWGSPNGKHPNVGVKHIFRNWTTGSGAVGSGLLALKAFPWVMFQVSSDGKWISLTKDDYIYVLDESDKLVDAEGNEVEFTPGHDLLRVSWVEGDPKKGMFYQYLLRRIAYKDEDGRLQKTLTYKKLLERAQRPTVQGSCFNYFLCNIPDDQYASIYDALDDHQLLVPGPEVNYPFHPDDWQAGEQKPPIEDSAVSSFAWNILRDLA